MSKKKKNKKHNNYNNSLKKSNLFKEFNEFSNMESEDEKYKKGMELIDNIASYKTPNEKDELLYYSNLAELYYYISKIKTKKYKLSDGKLFDVNAILEEKNRQYLDEIIKYKIISFDNYKKSLDSKLIKNCIEKIKEINKSQSQLQIEKIVDDMCYRNKEGLRILSQDLSNLYYIINDEENFILYGNYAIKYGSLNAISIFIKYYCDKLDYDNAYIYYNFMHNFNPNTYSKNPKSIIRNIMIKLVSYPLYYNFLYNSGMYEESLKIGQDYKKFIINNDIVNNESIEKNYKFLENANEHIKKCKLQIEESRNNKFTEDILLNYFDKEILKLMSNDNKIYILTSLNIYEYMKSSETTMDYSATLMPILKAIENIMFEIVAENYHTFILEKKDPRKEYITAFLNKYGRIIMKIDRLEYGQVLSLIGRKNNYKSIENTEILPNKYFMEFCDKNNVINSKDVIITIYTELDKLREKRNLVAHKNRVYEDCVEKCYDILLEKVKFINYLYKNFKFVFENKNITNNNI